MQAVLISTYELGRQPFGLASPAASLREAGADVVCLDLAVQRLDEDAVSAADLVAFYVPMHTATRIATPLLPRVKKLNPAAHICFYGLYAPMNEAYLRDLGAETILGGEFEPGLVSLARRLRAEGPGTGAAQPEPVISLDKHRFSVPDRSSLPPLRKYARLELGGGSSRTVGYVEASRGCKHLCRHCPVVPVYGGAFRVVQQEVVLEDIRRQVAAGAEHVTFGDPDFFNGVGHSLPLVRALHAEHPQLTYDVTIKVEHLLKHSRPLDELRETGCLFVTTAVESIDDRVLALLDKGHTRGDFIEVVRLCREAGLILNPTFVAFTPWITVAGYQELLETIAHLDLIDHVAPVQLAIRLLIPAGSKLLELPEVRELVGEFEQAALVHPWAHPEPEVDRLQARIQRLIQDATGRGETRREIFSSVWEESSGWPGASPLALPDAGPREDRASVPYLTEPWYC